ncbi:MAG: hypothetical protein D6743_11945, partial [Calditrichaeota bacterium]
ALVLPQDLHKGLPMFSTCSRPNGSDQTARRASFSERSLGKRVDPYQLQSANVVRVSSESFWFAYKKLEFQGESPLTRIFGLSHRQQVVDVRGLFSCG